MIFAPPKPATLLTQYLRGCPDTDGDGFVDPEDAFPQNPLQWADSDGDGYGDEVNKPGGDDCPTVFGPQIKTTATDVRTQIMMVGPMSMMSSQKMVNSGRIPMVTVMVIITSDDII